MVPWKVTKPLSPVEITPAVKLWLPEPAVRARSSFGTCRAPRLSNGPLSFTDTWSWSCATPWRLAVRLMLSWPLVICFLPPKVALRTLLTSCPLLPLLLPPQPASNRPSVAAAASMAASRGTR